MMDLSVFGLNDIIISLKVTHLANFFAMLIGFSSVIVLFIARNYSLTKSFYALFFLLTTALFFIVYAADYLLFFIGWEVMSISTYFLLSYSLSKEALYKYIIFAMASALSMFVAILILYSANHSFLYIDAAKSFEALGSFESMAFIGLILFAIFVKLGTIGVHYWLVDVYEESHNLFTPYLSAVLSKMGIYALIILVTQVVALSYSLAIIGLITSIIATFKAIQEDSIKRLLAYSSIAQLGYIVTVLGVADGMSGALYHSLIHTAVKLLLFINVAGIIYITGRSKFSELGGLIYRTPQSFVLLLIGIITLAGMPPLGGFASKFLIYTSLLDAKYLLILSAVMFSSASAFIYIYKLIYGIYLGHPTNKKLESVKEVPFSFLLPQYILAIVLIVLGTYPALVVPYFNTILVELNLRTMVFSDYATLISSFGKYNGFVVISTFGIIFVIVLGVFVNLRSKAKNVKDRFDIAYCGEEPNESSHLHYGFSMGKELKRVGFINLIYKNSVRPFYDFIAEQTLNFADIFKKIYTGNIVNNFNFAIIFAIILLWWSIK
ncbi:MAG: formate hydrogenlyase subunit 3/multisubunit Na+/H+ antiporter MnhD subunit [Sulfurimonas sp.]|jgi:formate hydrogenlyase subunit 3/multisubunit Na+/H+ antiporter MnhD subunit|uniref:proton-conducting transporter transmembrane domain-containing protein n=1 Tax=Sulfurimonas sp. TaxID=2022749 RepID=UPI0039E598AA